jgi:hypothetical protein
MIGVGSQLTQQESTPGIENFERALRGRLGGAPSCQADFAAAMGGTPAATTTRSRPCSLAA